MDRIQKEGLIIFLMIMVVVLLMVSVPLLFYKDNKSNCDRLRGEGYLVERSTFDCKIKMDDGSKINSLNYFNGNYPHHLKPLTVEGKNAEEN